MEQASFTRGLASWMRRRRDPHLHVIFREALYRAEIFEEAVADVGSPCRSVAPAADDAERERFDRRRHL